MLKKQIFFLLFICLCSWTRTIAQPSHNPSSTALAIIPDVEPQPLLAQAIRLHEALSFLGSSLSKEDTRRLKELQE